MNEDVGTVGTPFSAEAILETEDMTANTRVNYQPGMVRDQMNMGGQEMIVIRRFDKDVVWTLMQGMYMESAADENNERAPDYKLISREKMGAETVNGIPTTKYKSVYESADGKFGGFTWYTDDNIAVKAFMVSETKGEKTRIKYEFKSLQRGPQDNALFEVPAGYQKFSMGGFAGMKGMSGMGGAGAGAGAGYPAPPSGSGQAQAPASGQSGGAEKADDGSAAGGDSGFVGEVAEEATESAQETAKQETKRGINDTVRKGIGKLFGR